VRWHLLPRTLDAVIARSPYERLEPALCTEAPSKGSKYSIVLRTEVLHRQ
jgi:hypothetical protein